MGIKKYITNDLQYIIFSEVYQRVSSPHSKKKAQLILNAAIDCFYEKGIESVTIKTIARYASVSDTKVIYYFKSKDELIETSVMYTRYLFQKYVVKEMSKAVTITDMFEVYFDSCFLWPQHFKKHTNLWLNFLHLSNKDLTFKKINTKSVEVGLERLAALIEKGNSVGEFNCNSAVSARLIHTMITGSLLSMATQLAYDDKLSLDQVKMYCFNILNVTSKKL